MVYKPMQTKMKCIEPYGYAVCIYIYILAAGKIEYVPIRKIPIGIFYLLVPGGVYVSFRGAQKYQTYRTHVGESGERMTLMFESWRMYCAVF